MDATRTHTAHAESRSTRMDQRARQAQARLADAGFRKLMHDHNARQEQGR